MPITDDVLWECERVRSLARQACAEAVEMCEWTHDLCAENILWHREACTLVERTLELARERARILGGRWRGTKAPE